MDLPIIFPSRTPLGQKEAAGASICRGHAKRQTWTRRAGRKSISRSFDTKATRNWIEAAEAEVHLDAGKLDRALRLAIRPKADNPKNHPDRAYWLGCVRTHVLRTKGSGTQGRGDPGDARDLRSWYGQLVRREGEG
jgi:hypothetical protein